MGDSEQGTDKDAQKKSERLRDSMRKSSVKASDKLVGIKTFHGLKKQDETGKFDLEEVNEKTRFLDQVAQDRFISQKIFLTKIRAAFNPLKLLQTGQAAASAKIDMARQGFDAIWVFEIYNRKYE